MSSSAIGLTQRKPAAATDAKTTRATSPRSQTSKDALEEWETRVCPNLYSEGEVLKMICEFISDSISYGSKTELKDDNFFNNIRLIIGIGAIGFAGYAAGMVSFEKQKVLLGACVAGFFVLMFGMFIMDMFLLQGAALTYFDKEGTRHFLDVTLNRKNSSVCFRVRRGDAKSAPSCSRLVYLGRLFDSEGRLATEEVMEHLTKLNSSVAAGKDEVVDLIDAGLRTAQKDLKERKAD